jgi:hypothetical protein
MHTFNSSKLGDTFTVYLLFTVGRHVHRRATVTVHSRVTVHRRSQSGYCSQSGEALCGHLRNHLTACSESGPVEHGKRDTECCHFHLRSSQESQVCFIELPIEFRLRSDTGGCVGAAAWQGRAVTRR